MLDRSDYSNLEHEIVFYQGVKSSKLVMDPRELINSCPVPVRSKIRAVLVAVAKAPPKRFPGGGYWEQMHGSMKGWHELRVGGPGRTHYRLFCLLDYEAIGRDTPLLAVIAGMKKNNGEVFTEFDYARVRNFGDDYLSRNPRQIDFLRLSQSFFAWPLVAALASAGSQALMLCQQWLRRLGLISLR